MWSVCAQPMFISIHAPLTGCDPELLNTSISQGYFNPRTPYGMRQTSDRWESPSICYFNPRTPYGMRHVYVVWVCKTLQFQSTHPLRDATVLQCHVLSFICISIHAPLTGCDTILSRTRSHMLNFNPRTPYGMRRQSKMTACWLRKFQSTHPLRDATIQACFILLQRGYFNPRTPYGMRRYFLCVC